MKIGSKPGRKKINNCTTEFLIMNGMTRDSGLRNHADTSEGKKTSRISHNREILSGNCSNSDESDSAKMKKDGSDEDEKEDMIALEENCKL